MANAAYPVSIETLKGEEVIDQETELRQSQYLNSRVEQDHRAIKRIVKPMMGFKSFNSARRTLSGIEAMSIVRKGQVKAVERGLASRKAAIATGLQRTRNYCSSRKLFPQDIAIR